MLTGIYNVLQKIRSGEALNAKDKTLRDQGLVSILKQLHDDLDEAVLEAYGWSDLKGSPARIFIPPMRAGCPRSLGRHPRPWRSRCRVARTSHPHPPRRPQPRTRRRRKARFHPLAPPGFPSPHPYSQAKHSHEPPSETLVHGYGSPGRICCKARLSIPRNLRFTWTTSGTGTLTRTIRIQLVGPIRTACAAATARKPTVRRTLLTAPARAQVGASWWRCRLCWNPGPRIHSQEPPRSMRASHRLIHQHFHCPPSTRR
jgi:hypothetical protein